MVAMLRQKRKGAPALAVTGAGEPIARVSGSASTAPLISIPVWPKASRRDNRLIFIAFDYAKPLRMASIESAKSGKRLRHHLGRADAPFVIENDVDHFLRIVGDFEERHVTRTDKICLLEMLFHPLNQAFPMLAPKKNEGKLRDALRLDQRQHLEKLIERPKASGHEDKANAVFDEANFTREKIVEMDRKVRITIPFLLVGQFDVQADGFSLGERCPFVGCF